MYGRNAGLSYKQIMNSLEGIKKYLVSLALVCLTFSPGTAQDINEFRSRIYASYAEGDMADWRNVINEMERMQEQPGSKELLHEMLMAQYGYIGYCINENRKKEASRRLDRAQDILKRLRDEDPGNASLMALEGAFLGYEMGINKLKAVVLGPRAKEKIDAAVKKDPGAVRTLLEKANQLNFSPKIVGGDRGEAVEYYKKAIEEMESGRLQQNNWIYVNTLVVLAATYEEMGDYDNACDAYEKIMGYDPDVMWVKEELYPECREKAVRDRYPGP